MATPARRRAAARADTLLTWALGLYQAALALVLLCFTYALWPEPADGGSGWKPVASLWGHAFELRDDGRLILLVLCIGALGSFVHSATSFTSYVGNRRLQHSWAAWYALRPLIGAALALICYFALRGGLLAGTTTAQQVSVFGTAAVAGLTGMFSKQAADKLREVFDTLFRTASGQGDDARSDKLESNLPVTRLMIERRRISAVELPETGEAGVELKRLHAMLGGAVTRVPVLRADGSVRCVIHQSLIYKFLADLGMNPSPEGHPTIDSATLADFLAAPGMDALVSGSLAWVGEHALLSDAKARMEETPHCQDVFVTAHGLNTEPVLGWLTDAEVRVAAMT